MKKRVSKLKGHAEDGISVKKYPRLVAHNIHVELKLKFCQFCCNQFRKYGY